jgi:hypothetical protein
MLSSLGLSVVASSVPDDMTKQVLLIIAGIIMFIIIGWWLRDLARAKSSGGRSALRPSRCSRLTY